MTGFELEVGLVIEIDMAHTDLAQLRFAHSPVRELVASLRVLHDRSRHQMYGAWLSTVRGRLGGLRVDLLTGLAPSTPYSLDFAAPSSTRPWEVLDDELAVVAASPPATVRAELDWVSQGRRLPEVLGPLYDDPGSQLPVVTAEMARYWRAAVEPVWPRLRALCSADLAHRMEQFAAGGIARVLQGLHPEVAFEDGRLLIDKPYTCHHRVDLTGTGIVLVPCAFSWPTLSVQCCGGAEQPALSYPPRGVAGLWGQAPDDRPTADWWAGPGPRCWPPWTCRRPLPSWPGSSASARPRSASISRPSEVLGLRVKTYAAYGPSERWLTVVAPEEPDGVELVLHLTDDAARAFRDASREFGRPVLSLHTDDCASVTPSGSRPRAWCSSRSRPGWAMAAWTRSSTTAAATCSTSTSTERRNRHAAHPPTQPLIIGPTDPHTGKRSRGRFGLDRITGTSHRTDFAVPAAGRGG